MNTANCNAVSAFWNCLPDFTLHTFIQCVLRWSLRLPLSHFCFVYRKFNQSGWFAKLDVSLQQEKNLHVFKLAHYLLFVAARLIACHLYHEKRHSLLCPSQHQSSWLRRFWEQEFWELFALLQDGKIYFCKDCKHFWMLWKLYFQLAQTFDGLNIHACCLLTDYIVVPSCYFLEDLSHGCGMIINTTNGLVLVHSILHLSLLG